ncbi:MAG: MarR family transcriptional regulator [Hyphomicrobiales bacterium]|nr:MarR family transcriptional regulator [Hyphomicrobiales bacterium]
MPAPALSSARVDAVRRFNRFYTRRIGVLQEGWASSEFSLAQARVLYELTRRERPSATELGRDLGLEPGYLSRILRGFEARGLIVRETSQSDGRRSLLSLTLRGRQRFGAVETRSNGEVEAMLASLPAPEQQRLVRAMGTIEHVLAGPAAPPAVVLRPPRAGDFGWIVSRHGALYQTEYGWDERLEALTAEIVAAFVRAHDPARERCWMAELDGETVGSVMLVKDTEETARLRLLLVEPSARGHGIGGKLVQEAIDFARAAHYRHVTLWTHSVLTAARRIYQKAGFTLTSTDTHDSFGTPVTGETWDLALG